MIKLFFKKLLYTVVFFGALLGISTLVTMIVQNNEELTDNAKFWISILPAVVVMLTVAVVMRLKSKKLKEAYLADLKKDEDYVVLGKVFKSRENLVHTLVFAILALALFVSIAVSEDTPFGFLLAGSLILVGICTVVFYIVNSVIWYVVHGRWIKESVSKEKERKPRNQKKKR